MGRNPVFVARLLTGRRFDAFVFSALTWVSSASMFWLPAGDILWGSLSLLAALALCAADARGRLHPAWCTRITAFCLGVTSSNWIAGMLVAGIRHHWRRALQIVSNSLSVVVVLWAIQRMRCFPLLISSSVTHTFHGSSCRTRRADQVRPRGHCCFTPSSCPLFSLSRSRSGGR